MPTVESVIKDIKTLEATGQIVLGSFATEVTDEVKENRFQGERCVLIVTMMKYQETVSLMVNKDISVSPVEKLLMILHTHQDTTVQKIQENGYCMQNV